MFILHDNDYEVIEGEDPQLIHRLPTGIYISGVTPRGTLFRQTDIVTDVTVGINSQSASQVTREIRDFFNYEITARLSRSRMNHRRGVIIHGEPGTGKTCLVRSLVPEILGYDPVVLIEPPAGYLRRHIIPGVRSHDPDRHIVIIWDEFDQIVRGSASSIIQLLDGIDSPDHILVLATTNFINKIPDQLKLRPSRFGLIMQMPPMNRAMRKHFTDTKYPLLPYTTTSDLISITMGRPLDYLEESCKLALMGYTIPEIRERIDLAWHTSQGSNSTDPDDEDDYEDEDEDTSIVLTNSAPTVIG